MARRRKGRAINGIILLDKATGGSSNQVLQQVRRRFNAQKAGHTGALDPLASGMLPICLGEATKFSQFLLDADKTYEVTAHLGIRTTTSDADGEVVAEKTVESSVDEVRSACLSFIGHSKQVPSMFSALKYQGQPLYVYARQGIEVPREARDITIYSLEITRLELPEVDMVVRCSKGTYIRSLVDDIGQMLGCGAYVTRLHRTQVADYPNDRMLSMEAIEALAKVADDFSALDEQLLPMDTAVKALPSCTLDQAQWHRFEHGQSITPCNDVELMAGQHYRVYAQQDDDQPLFLGVGEAVLEAIDQPVGERTGKLYVVPRRRVVYEHESNT